MGETRIWANHPTDTRYVKHCVDCGLKVLEYKRDWNGIDRASIGEVLFSLPGHRRDLAGYRCPSCRTRLMDFVAIEYYEGEG